MSDREIARYERANENFLRAMVGKFKGRDTFSLRNWYTEDNELRPSKNGLNLSTEEYEEFREMVAALDEELGFNALVMLPEPVQAAIKALATHCLTDNEPEIRDAAKLLFNLTEEEV